MSDYKEITRKEFVESTKSGFHTLIGELTYEEKAIMEKNIHKMIKPLLEENFKTGCDTYHIKGHIVWEKGAKDDS